MYIDQQGSKIFFEILQNMKKKEKKNAAVAVAALSRCAYGQKFKYMVNVSFFQKVRLIFQIS